MMNLPAQRVSATIGLCFRETGIWRTETAPPKPAHHIPLIVRRDKVPPRNPTNSGLLLGDQEISVYSGLRGGAEKTRTPNQTIIIQLNNKDPFGKIRQRAQQSQRNR
jgi:hypothetical protein